MAACGSLQHIFEKPLPENNSTLFDSISSWTHIQSMKKPAVLVDDFPSPSSPSPSPSPSPSSFNEIFGEMHFKESSSSPSSYSCSASSSSSSSSFPLPISSSPPSSSSSILTEMSPRMEKLANKSSTTTYVPTTTTTNTKHYRHSDSFSSMNSDSLSLCTEGLGSESFDDVEDSKSDNDNNPTTNHWRPHHHRRTSCFKHTQSDYLSAGECKRSRISGVEFPPPISSIGRMGKPWVCFKSYRNNGRFILKEVRIPTQEFLHACREDGRLKLQFIHSDDETIEEDEDEDEDEEEEEDEAIDDIKTNEENDVARDENKGETS